MKNNISLFLFAILAASIIFVSCSDSSNPSSNNNGTTDSLMFSFDSLTVYSDSLAQTNAYIISLDNCKVTKYRLQCLFLTDDTINQSTIYSKATVSLSYNNDTLNGYELSLQGNGIHNVTIDKSITFQVNVPFQLIGAIAISFENAPRDLHKYIKVKNFKLSKTN